MSFTVTVKEELITVALQDKIELTALIKMSGSIGLTSNGLTLSLLTTNARIARYLYETLEKSYHVAPEIKYHHKTNLKKNRIYTVFLDEKVEQILTDLHLSDSFFGLSTAIQESILEDDEKGQSYLRGAFLSSGSIREPDSGKYQLEFFSVYLDHAEGLAQLMQKFMLDAKVIEHKNGAVTYLQKAEDIMDLLLVIGALEAKEKFEEIKVYREARNDLNRANNAETANIAKTVTASMKAINNIIKIKDNMGLEALPIELQQVAYKRIEHPDYSIQRLADSFEPPLSKSGVNHRLRKINKIASEL